MFYFSCVNFFFVYYKKELIYLFFQICSNINTCVCDLGFGGHDCSKLVPTFPPPFTNKPTGPTTPVPDAGLTPSNTYIRKYYTILCVFFWFFLSRICPEYVLDSSWIFVLSIIGIEVVIFKFCLKNKRLKAQALLNMIL